MFPFKLLPGDIERIEYRFRGDPDVEMLIDAARGRAEVEDEAYWQNERVKELERLAAVTELAAKVEERVRFEAKPNGRPRWLRSERGRQTVVVMRRLREEGLTGGEVAVRLNSAGLTTPSGKPWDRKTVHHFAKQSLPDEQTPPRRLPTINPPKPPKVEPYWTCSQTVASLLDRERFEGPVWEPCCGKGHVADELTQRGYEVVATDKHGYGYPRQERQLDVLTDPPPSGVRSVVTNPPFSGARTLLERLCRSGASKVAVLLPLGGWSRAMNPRITGDLSLARAYYLGKVPFWDHEKGRRFVPRWPSWWFVLEKGHRGPVEVRRG